MSVRAEILKSITQLCEIERADLSYFCSSNGYAIFNWNSYPGIFASQILLKQIQFKRRGRRLNIAEDINITSNFLVGARVVAAEIQINDTSVYVSQDISYKKYRTELDADIAAWTRLAVSHDHDLCEAAGIERQQRLATLVTNGHAHEQDQEKTGIYVEHPILGPCLFGQTG